MYKIEVNESNRYYSGNDSVELGCVLKNNERFVPILYKGADVKHGYSMAITYNGKELLIHMDKTYKDLLYNKFEIVQPLIFHEIGHLENGDFYKDPIPSELRAFMLMDGKVLPQELAADKFAVNILGKKAVKNSLNYLLETRKKQNNVLAVNNYSRLAGIKEIELRIKNL